MDLLFREYLVAKAETLKTELANPELDVQEIIAKAQEVLKLEGRIGRMDRPIIRRKKAPPAE